MSAVYEPQEGDVVVDQTGSIYSRRDDHWIDGGWPPQVQWVSSDDNTDHVPLTALDDELYPPLVLLVRYPEAPGTQVIEVNGQTLETTADD